MRGTASLSLYRFLPTPVNKVPFTASSYRLVYSSFYSTLSSTSRNFIPFPLSPLSPTIRFSSTSSAATVAAHVLIDYSKMDPTVGCKIDGKAVSEKIRTDIKSHIATQRESNPEYQPSLVIVQVGKRSDSTTYVRMKTKAADESGISCMVEQFDESTTESELIARITALNESPTVHGILIQLPLPGHMSERTVTDAVSRSKDVDGFGTENIGELAKRDGKPLFTPCTPKGVMALLASTGVTIEGKHAVVIGRSNIVGRPVSYLLQAADATVTLCHSKTVDLASFTKRADILVVAIGLGEHVLGSWIKPGAIVIDVGTNYIEDATRASGYRLVGDVHFPSASEVASHITPVPGGVGPMTVTMLLQNVVEAADRAYAK